MKRYLLPAAHLLLSALLACLLSCSCNLLPPAPLNNQEPAANAGEYDYVMIDAEYILIDGTGSSDPEGAPLTYTWQLVELLQYVDEEFKSSTPALRIAATAEPGQARVLPPEGSSTFEPGTYLFALTVYDGFKRSPPDFVRREVIMPDAWVGDPDDEVFGLSKTASLQAAIDAVADGQTRYVAVDYNTYTGQITIPPRVKVIGLVEDGKRPVITGTLTAADTALVELAEEAVINNIRLYVQPQTGVSATDVTAIEVTGSGAEINNCVICAPRRSAACASDGIKLAAGAAARVTGTVLDLIGGEGIEIGNLASLEMEDCLVRETSGSAIYGYGSLLLQLTNSVIYMAGWHGIHGENCQSLSLEHMTLVNTAADNYAGPTHNQSSLFSDGCLRITVKSSLLQLADVPVYGIYLKNTTPLLNPDFQFNCLLSLQDTPRYYGGEFPVNEAAANNYTAKGSAGLSDPEHNDFNPVAGSPALGRGEAGSNAGLAKPLSFDY